MELGALKELMLLPDREYILNQDINIGGIDVHLLSFTIEEGKNRLWLIYEEENNLEIEDDYDIEVEETPRIRTNREDKLRHIEGNKTSKYFFIEKMKIQDQIVSFTSSTSSYVYEMNMEGIMNLQHFVEKGLIPNSWDHVRLKNICIAQYEQDKNEEIPVIDNTKELDIEITIGPDTEEVPIGHVFKTSFGKQNTKVSYFDKELGGENYFFINEIYSFDIYKEIEESVEKIDDLEMRARVLRELMEAARQTYPKDKNLAAIKYEARDDVQLNFYMKEFLDADQIDYFHNEAYEDEDSTIGAASSIGFIWSSNEKELGKNGYKLRDCILQPIDKDFTGDLEIELFSRYEQIPSQIVG